MIGQYHKHILVLKMCFNVKLVFLVAVFITLCIGIPTGPNVCPRRVRMSNGLTTWYQLVNECCSDYFEDKGSCKECEAGKFGKNCSFTCLAQHYGISCKHVCNCNQNQVCDPRHGCLCKQGFTEPNCSKICPARKYGVYCNETCDCGNNTRCHPETGQCVCDFGLQGRNCSEDCSSSNTDCLEEIHGDNMDKCTEESEVASCRQPQDNSSGRRLFILVIIPLTGVIFIALVTLCGIKLLCRQCHHDPTEDEVHYHEIDLRDESLPPYVNNNLTTNQPEPLYVRQPRRLSLPDILISNERHNMIYEGASLPNIRSDGIYVNQDYISDAIYDNEQVCTRNKHDIEMLIT